MYYKYYVNMDERGDFSADVRNDKGETVFEIADVDHLWELIDAGYMAGKRDLEGLSEYLYGTGVLTEHDRLVTGN